MATRSPTKTPGRSARRPAAPVDMPTAPDRGGFVKPRPKKPTNAKMAAEFRKQELVAALEKQAEADRADPKAAKARKAKEKKALEKLEALAAPVDRHVYVPQYADEICNRMAEGEHVQDILKELGISFVSMCTWMRKVPAFAAAFAVARENQAHLYISQITKISDDVEAGKVDMAKLQIDTRKWLASKILSKLYGDKVQVSGDGENPLVTKMIMNSDDLVKRIKGGL